MLTLRPVFAGPESGIPEIAHRLIVSAGEAAADPEENARSGPGHNDPHHVVLEYPVRPLLIVLILWIVICVPEMILKIMNVACRPDRKAEQPIRNQPVTQPSGAATAGDPGELFRIFLCHDPVAFGRI